MVAIVIVPAELKPQAEQAVKQLAPESSGESFIVPLKTVTSAPGVPTHWACLPIASNDTLVQIQTMVHQPPFSPQSILGICDSEQIESEFDAVLRAHHLESVDAVKP